MIPTDPLYASQWHFGLIGDIETIWDEYTGSGVNVGVYDSGIDYNHPDLIGNYDSSLHVLDALGNPVDPFPNAGGAHGTACAGLIGASANNGEGGVGVAHGVTLTGVNIFESGVYGYVNGGTPLELAAFIDVIEQAQQFDVMSNSWGITPGYGAYQSVLVPGQTADLVAAYELIAEVGRGGLGTVNVQAAGNDNMNANGDGANASRFTITIAATEFDGTASDYSNFGSGILVAAPAAAVTTDISGGAGYDAGDYTTSFNGTSAATPVTAGVISLMLEANADLGWRDVQNILANSASQTGSAFGGPAAGFEDGAWFSTGAGNFNGGGHTFNVSYGYGMVNAFAAVRMAEVWTMMNGGSAVSAGSVAANALEEQTVAADSGTIDLAITDASTVTSDLVVAGGVEVETIIVTFSVTHTWASDLDIYLVAPDGTRFMLMQDEGSSTLTDNGFQWKFEIAAARGYSSAGTWTLEVTDDAGGDVGTLHDWQLDFYGSAESNDDIHTVTEDYAALAAAEPGRVIEDTNGGTDWLNTVALQGDVLIDLTSDIFSVNGSSFATIVGAGFENIVSGDGDDVLAGNALDNVLMGMRGTDQLFGLAGDDVLNGGVGVDHLYGGEDNDTLNGGTGDDLMFGGTGNDRYYVSSAGDQVMELSGEGTDTVISYLYSYTLTNHVERLELQGSAANGFGNSLNNTLVGNGLNNVLNGGAGNDYMVGGRGDDHYTVGSAGDVVVEYNGQGTDTVFSYAASYTLSNHVERLELLGAALNGNGNSLNNTLVGNGHDNYLNGAGGNDYMVGGLGNDRYVVDSAGDVVIEYNGQGTDTVYSNLASYTLGNNVERLELQGAALNGTGNGLNNTLVGNAHDNILNGGAGVDFMVGGLGDDRYYVGVPGDVVIEYSGQGIDTVYSFASSYTLGNHVERLELQGSAVNGTGNNLSNTLIGSTGANTLRGEGGLDYIEGKAGADILYGGAGADVFIFNNAAHSQAGAGNRDTLGDFASGDTIRLSNIDANTGTGADDAFNWIGTSAFSGSAGELRYSAYGPNAIIQGDVNGDGIADFEIGSSGYNAFVASDFML